ncbi:hypothetical protein AYL99_11323 [Fonsecaea erecta]|uniref:tRNA-splicing endonuclease subunit Sen15 domain-containing protein n=1 Tax=Fonsecaea erecta TaxID=1367422 RepID=A0A178Z364_9EURO|nr:hypothetical protein AYL99_11323 [Fonsecaea erecta]OAP54222.1 hypothetical protein AYL99_11323 [Fonsecaea erecta]
MAASIPTTPSTTPPTASAVSTLIDRSGAKSASESLAVAILHNLQHQHEWTDLRLHLVYPSHSAVTAGLVDLDGIKFVHSNPSSRSPSPSLSGSGSSTPTIEGNGNTSTLPAATTASPGGGIVVPIISGLPPQHAYLHPDLQTYLIKHKIKDSEIPLQREFVLPLALGEKWSLARLCGVFDQLPEREVIRLSHPSQTGGDQRGKRGSSNADEIVNGNSTPLDNTATEGPSTKTSPRTDRTGRERAETVYEHKDTKRVLFGMRARDGGGGDGTIVYYIMQEGEVKPRQNG